MVWVKTYFEDNAFDDETQQVDVVLVLNGVDSNPFDQAPHTYLEHVELIESVLLAFQRALDSFTCVAAHDHALSTGC
jgi:hypothetical protein